MSWRLLLLPTMLVACTACGAGDTLATSEPDGYYYATPEQEPHPAIAEGKPTVEYNGFTFYACPPLAVGEETPLLEHDCLTPGDAGASKYGDHSMLEASIICADGRRLTDAGSLGLGFVGRPLIGQTQASPDRRAAFHCLWGLDRGTPTPSAG